MANPRYAPEMRVAIDGIPVPAALRACITGVSFETAFEGVDRVELTLANEQLRWLDHPVLALDRSLTLWIGYAPDPLEQIFVGPIVSLSPTFPNSSMPTLTVVAQDRRLGMQHGTGARWFAVSGTNGSRPLPDQAVAAIVSSEHGMVPLIDPLASAISAAIGGAELALAQSDPEALQKLIRKQVGENDLQLLERIARENGWEMQVDHSGPLGGLQLRFVSFAQHLTDVTLKYGRSLIEFTPRISTVGQIAAVTASFWLPDIRTELTVSVGWDWDRSSLSVSIRPGFGLPSGTAGTPEALAAAGQRVAAQLAAEQVATPSSTGALLLLEEPVDQLSAARVLLTKLLARLNARLTGSGSCIGDIRIKPGTVLQLEGLGEQFGGLYRVTSATHSLNSGGYQTTFEVRKEIWFRSIPAHAQGAIRLPLAGLVGRGAIT